MKRKVILEGEIADKFGKEFSINAKSFGDVVKCLDLNFPDFRKYLIESEKNGIGFICEVAGSSIKQERELLLEYPEGTMTISAVPVGSKSGGAMILAGVALALMLPGIGAAMYAGSLAQFGAAYTSMTAFSAAAGVALGSTAGLLVASLAVNLAITGLQQVMAPDPSVDNDQDESYLFQGTGQEALEGDPVPILYGRLRIPGRPISSQIKNERQAFISLGTDAETPTPTGQDSAAVPPSQVSLATAQTQRTSINFN